MNSLFFIFLNVWIQICLKSAPVQNVCNLYKEPQSSPTHFHCILTDLVNRLWSVVNESLAGDPVVFSQLHCVLQQEADPGGQLLVIH